MFTAVVSSGASGYAQNGVLVTTSAQSSATGETYEEAYNGAKQLSQQIADSTLQNDINVLNQTITMSELGYLGIGETGPTGATGGYLVSGNQWGETINWNSNSNTWQITGESNLALGNNAGYTGQGLNSIALGFEAGYRTQGSNAIAIGEKAGFTGQGNSAIAL